MVSGDPISVEDFGGGGVLGKSDWFSLVYFCKFLVRACPIFFVNRVSIYGNN
jgi:hypothetical protein